MEEEFDEGAQPLMSAAEWEAHAGHVTERMKAYTKQYVTPISKVIEHDCGILLGTGNYIEFLGKRYLLTNEHVAKKLTTRPLAHQFFENDTVFGVTNPFHVYPLPIDVGITEINQATWDKEPHSSSTVVEDQWALAHFTVPRELLFFKGYAGERSKFHFGHLFSKATSYGCQEVELPRDDNRFLSRFHFAIDYRPDRAKPSGEDKDGLPLPKGFSGSLVWNTRFVEFWGTGEEWKPELAQVTGLVWGWPSEAGVIVATRIEYVRSFLLRFIYGGSQ
jgi:hypothetical protein